jgi:hypothetical protein
MTLLDLDEKKQTKLEQIIMNQISAILPKIEEEQD